MGRVTEIKELLLKSCCTIIYKGSVKGTGWVAGSNIIVSAGHCFSEEGFEPINADEINKDEIRVRFWSDTNKTNFWKEYTVKFLCGVYTVNPFVDFCVLLTEDNLPAPALPIAKSCCLEGDFFTAGCGETLECVSNAQGEIIGLLNTEEKYRPLKLSSKQCSELGYSGAPIYSQIADGVIGIQSRITEKESGAESETAVAFPIEYLEKITMGHITKGHNEISNTSQSVADWIRSLIVNSEDVSVFFSDIKLYQELLNCDPQKKYVSNIEKLYMVMSRLYHKIPGIIGYDVDHSASHVKRVLNTIAVLVGDYQLNDTELAVLITCALVQDIGLCVSIEQKEELLRLDSIEGLNLRLSNVKRNLFGGDIDAAIRYVFERRRDLLIKENIIDIGGMDYFKGYHEDYFQVVFDCISIHDSGFQIDDSMLTEKFIDGNSIDLTYISVLLHLADVLDYDITGTQEERKLFDLSKYIQCSEIDSGIPSLIISNIDLKIRKTNRTECYNCNSCPIEVYINPFTYRELKSRLNKHPRKKGLDIYNNIQCRILEYKEYLEREIQKCKTLMKKSGTIRKLRLEDRVAYENTELITPNYKIDFDYSAVVPLLLGEQIYGNRRVGLREIIQNSIDACKYRLERTKKRNIYQPSITIEMNKADNEIVITDNGVGMNRYVIENYFLKIGRSIYDSEKYKESNYQFTHAGYYGIGFFSAFMLSDVVRITTRHMDESVSWNVRVTTEGRYASISKASESDSLSDAGTSIVLEYDKVEKNFNIYEEENFDLQYEMKSYISRYFLGDIKDGKSIEITICDTSNNSSRYYLQYDKINLESVSDFAKKGSNYVALSDEMLGNQIQCVIKTDTVQGCRWYKYCKCKDGKDTFVQVETQELGIYQNVIYKKIFHGGESICVYVPPEYWETNKITKEKLIPFNYDNVDRQAVFVARSEKVYGNISIEDMFKIAGWAFPNELHKKPVTAFIGKYNISKIAESVVVYTKNKFIEQREPNEGATLNGSQFRDDVYIRNVYIPDFHIILPYSIFCINGSYLPEIKKMIINIEDEVIVPNIDRNDVPVRMKEKVSQKICQAIFGWYGNVSSEEKAIKGFCELFSI